MYHHGWGKFSDLLVFILLENAIVKLSPPANPSPWHDLIISPPCRSPPLSSPNTFAPKILSPMKSFFWKKVPQYFSWRRQYEYIAGNIILLNCNLLHVQLSYVNFKITLNLTKLFTKHQSIFFT